MTFSRILFLLVSTRKPTQGRDRHFRKTNTDKWDLALCFHKCGDPARNRKRSKSRRQKLLYPDGFFLFCFPCLKNVRQAPHVQIETKAFRSTRRPNYITAVMRKDDVMLMRRISKKGEACMFQISPCSNTPDPNVWVAIRLRQSLMTNWSLESGVLEVQTYIWEFLRTKLLPCVLAYHTN